MNGVVPHATSNKRISGKRAMIIRIEEDGENIGILHEELTRRRILFIAKIKRIQIKEGYSCAYVKTRVCPVASPQVTTFNESSLYVPEKLCCSTTFREGELCLLKIEDAKRMVKYPRYQVSCLTIEYNAEKQCVVHLIASALPNLTKLVLSKRVPSRGRCSTLLQGRTLREAPVVVEEHKKSLNGDPVFKKLVEHTPNLKKLIILGNDGVYWGEYGGTWDLGTFYSITGWKNLTNLELSHIPLDDRWLLIEIRQECRNLETLDLTNRREKSYFLNCFHDKELARMSTGNCELNKFSFEAILVAHIAAVFHSLAKHPELKKVTMKMLCQLNGITHSSRELLLYTCSEITTFSYHITGLPSDHADISECALSRLKEQLNIPCFKFAVARENTTDLLSLVTYGLGIYVIL